ncbi:hypothetical protein AB205_0177200 [Aquarana catesbeiana]|uniref:Uncharacterized protein n=1 Tax=Aquarana catesbeiana TaxID=8400 RepID=A0A2G9QB10_AQUCT|nr:hypothetical protein AB205_0177200 [Aquarana catesbeiana]
MAETEQVSHNYTNEEEEESPEAETSRSRRRRFKASNMSFGEILEMVDIMMESMDLTPTPMSERPRSWRKWSRVCTAIWGYDDRKISSGSGGRT